VLSDAVRHLDQVSIFAPSLTTLFVLLGINWSITAIHIFEEWKGEVVPLWRVFGAIVGVSLPDWLGFLVFTIGLTLLLWGLGLAGIAGWLPSVGPLSTQTSVWALGAMIGARLSDTLVSHWSLYGLGYRPNPGLKSTPLYVAEAIFLLLAFWKGLTLSPLAAWIGFACGAGFFILVLPVIATDRLIPAWRRVPWVRNEPLPAWTRE
jgi:hypothetical protein